MRSIGVGVLTGVGLLAAIGLFMLGLGLRNVYRALASRDWPTATGVVVESSTSSSVTRDGRRTSTMYGARTVVQYRVAGREYSTGTRHFGQFEGSGDASEATLEHYRFPVGREVVVAYDPQSPSVATVHRGIQLSALVLPIGGIAFLAAALMAFFMVRGSGGMGSVMTVFALVFCGIGVALLVPGGVNVWRAQSSVAWPTTSALIVYGTPANNSAETAVEANSSDSLTVSTAEQRLIYRFEVNGRRHFGNVRRFGQLAGSSDGEWSASIARRYPLGQRATVSYSPTNPDLSVLEPGIDKESWYLPGAGLAFLLFGSAVLVFAIPALTR